MAPTTSPPQVYEFGPFRLDGARRVLSRNGSPLGVRAKALDLLLILVEHRGHPVSKEELLNALWPDTEVGEHNLTVTIAALRKALGEKSGENRYIATLPGRGYTFVAELSGSEVGRINPPWWRAGWVAVGGVLISIAAIAIATVERPQHDVVRTTMLTTSGAASLAAISPNGKQIAFVSGTPDEQAILLNNVGGGTPTPLLPPATVRYASVAFTPDGQSILFVAKREGDLVSSLYTVRTRDGGATKIKENVESAAIAPDGDQFVFARDDLRKGESFLVLSSLRSGEERTLAVRKLPSQLEHPAWSPDGKRIACVEVSFKNQLRTSHIIELGLDGTERVIANGPFQRVSALTWTRNNGTLLASARDHKSGAVRLWTISFQSGIVRPLTGTMTSMMGVATDAEGRTAVTVQKRLIVAVWIAAAGKWAEARRVLYSDTSGGRAAWMPGGNLLLEGDYAGAGALGILDAQRLTVRPILTGAQQGWMPTVCANGEDVYYRARSSTGKGDAIWRSDVRGAKPVEVRTPLEWATLSCAKDVLYAEFNSLDRIGIWRLPRNGGDAVRLSTHKALWPQLSPDGRWVACFYSNSDKPNDRMPENIAILPADGGEPVRMFPLPPSADEKPGLAWNAESTGLYFVQNRKGASGIWFQPIEGGEASRVVDFPGEQILHFAWSPDWKQLVVSRAVVGQDVVLLEGLSN